MKILLVVSSANDIFIYNLAKWLKLSINCSLDAFELNSSSSAHQEDSSSLFDNIGLASKNKWWMKLKLFRFVFSPISFSKQLDGFVSQKRYDVIHIQGVWSYIPLTQKLKSNTEKLFVSFWGNEHLMGKIWSSHVIYDYKLKKFIKSVDGITGATARLQIMHKLFPQTPLYECRLGIASLDQIEILNKTYTKDNSKKYWHMPTNKTSVLIGYSGKRIHNHIEIIHELKKHVDLYDKIHLLAPMTRGATTSYIKEVEMALSMSGYSYTLIKDKFLSDDEIARLRHSTDIVLQFAQNDAYSRSIIESICAGAIMIYGNWINYKDLLANDNFEAIEANSISDGIRILENYIVSPEKYTTIGERNTSVGCKQFLWSECIKDFVSIYKGRKDVEVF